MSATLIGGTTASSAIGTPFGMVPVISGSCSLGYYTWTPVNASTFYITSATNGSSSNTQLAGSTFTLGSTNGNAGPAGITISAGGSGSLTYQKGSGTMGVYNQWASNGNFVNPLTSITVANGIAFGGGQGGEIQTSTNGTTWAYKATPIASNVVGVAHNGSNLYMAVTTNGGVATSPDTTTWTVKTSLTGGASRGVVWGNSKFIAIGAGATTTTSLYTSVDGVAWAAVTTVNPYVQYGLAYNGSLFVAVGATGSIQTSPDGTTWTTRSSGTTQTLYGVTYINGAWFAYGNTGILLTSSTGTTWTAVTLPASVFTITSVVGITYVNSLYVVSIGFASGKSAIVTTPDLTTWTWRGPTGYANQQTSSYQMVNFSSKILTLPFDQSYGVAYSADGLQGAPFRMAVFAEPASTVN